MLILELLLIAVATRALLAPIIEPSDASRIIPGHYIVVLKRQDANEISTTSTNQSSSASLVERHRDWLRKQMDGESRHQALTLLKRKREFEERGRVAARRKLKSAGLLVKLLFASSGDGRSEEERQRDSDELFDSLPLVSTIRHWYHALVEDQLVAYAGAFTAELLQAIRSRPDVDFIEADQVVHVLDREYLSPGGGNARKMHGLRIRGCATLLAQQLGQQRDAPWGLSRLAHASLPPEALHKQGTFLAKLHDGNDGDRDGGRSVTQPDRVMRPYRYPKSAGSGVSVYVIDTGINTEHVEFAGGRARWGVTIPFADRDIDGNGHGTHCAGTIAGRRFGVAKKAQVVAVKVLRTEGFGSNSDVIAGVEWVMRDHRGRVSAASGRPVLSVANMSLGGGRSLALEAAVERAIRAGVHFAVAAGNDAEDACHYSPAAAPGPLTVGASDPADLITTFSNHGPCVDLFAPGLGITSAWIGSSTATNTISGTSMASPHVAGVIALYLSELATANSADSPTPLALKEMILRDAQRGILRNLPLRSPNTLASTRPLVDRALEADRGVVD